MNIGKGKYKNDMGLSEAPALVLSPSHASQSHYGT